MVFCWIKRAKHLLLKFKKKREWIIFSIMWRFCFLQHFYLPHFDTSTELSALLNARVCELLFTSAFRYVAEKRNTQCSDCCSSLHFDMLQKPQLHFGRLSAPLNARVVASIRALSVAVFFGDVSKCGLPPPL